METLTSQEAAARCGVNVQKLHRKMAAAGIDPIMKAPGLRGAKFWLSRDVDQLAAELATEAAA